MAIAGFTSIGFFIGYRKTGFKTPCFSTALIKSQTEVTALS